MSHPVKLGSHSKLHQHLLDGNKINIQGFGHVVCIRPDALVSWTAKEYEVIEDGGDSILIGRRKQ